MKQELCTSLVSYCYCLQRKTEAFNQTPSLLLLLRFFLPGKPDEKIFIIIYNSSNTSFTEKDKTLILPPADQIKPKGKSVTITES